MTDPFAALYAVAASITLGTAVIHAAAALHDRYRRRKETR